MKKLRRRRRASRSEVRERVWVGANCVLSPGGQRLGLGDDGIRFGNIGK